MYIKVLLGNFFPSKILQRNIILCLGLGEYFIRKLDGTSVRGEAHSLYLIQVRFGILGRYMNLTAGMYIAL